MFATVVRLVDENLEAELQYEDELPGLVRYPDAGMPNEPWDRRYYRQTATTGQEVALVKRVQGTAFIVIRPDMSLAKLKVTKSRTVQPEPDNLVYYTALPVLSEAQKAAATTQAEDAIRNNTAVELPMFNPRGAANRAIAGQLGFWALQQPQALSRFARHCLRSGWRTGGLLAVVYVFYRLAWALHVPLVLKDMSGYAGRQWTEWAQAFQDMGEEYQAWGI